MGPLFGSKKGPRRASKKGQKMPIFGPLRRKVQGEWGGSAHSPDPTAQSAQPPAPQLARVGRGAEGRARGGGGAGGRVGVGPPGRVAVGGCGVLGGRGVVGRRWRILGPDSMLSLERRIVPRGPWVSFRSPVPGSLQRDQRSQVA